MRNDLVPLGALASGEMVYDRPNSHVHAKISELLPEIFANLSSREERFITHEHDFGRVVGSNYCVATGSGDTIVWAYRPKRQGPTRFVMNRRPEPSNMAVVILKRDDYEPYYILITAFIGRLSGPEPWDPRATEADQEFWGSHALIWGSEPIVALA